MNRKLLSLGLVLLIGAGCTLPTEEDLTNAALKKLNIDKDTAMAYTEIAMKQAAMASAAMTAGTGISAAKVAPKLAINSFRQQSMFSALAVTKAQCVKYEEALCTVDGLKCSFKEDYTGCGSDFTGTVTRTFEGDPYDTYKVTVKSEGYSEKPTADPGHYGFGGIAVLTGSVKPNSANISMHIEGDTTTNLGGKLVTIAGSSDTTFTFLNGKLTVNGTQTGQINHFDAAASISITELTFEASCATGPTAGTVKALISGKEAVFSVAGCGAATLTIEGEAVEFSAEEIARTFLPDTGSGKGFDGIISGADGGNLLSGDWYFEGSGKVAYLYIYKEYAYGSGDITTSPTDSGTAGKIYVSYYSAIDVGGDGDFWGIGDTYKSGFGTISDVTDTKVTILWDYYEEGSNAYSQEYGGVGPSPTVNKSGQSVIYDYKKSGSTSLVFDGTTFTSYGDYSRDGEVPSADTSPFAGSWVYSTPTSDEYLYLQDGYIYIDRYTFDEATFFDGSDGDTYYSARGVYSYTESQIEPLWEYRSTDIYDSEGIPTTTIHYDYSDYDWQYEVGDVAPYSINAETNTLTFSGYEYTRN